MPLEPAASASSEPRHLARSWRAVLGCLEVQLNPHTFATWLKGAAPGAYDGRTLVIDTPNDIARDWLDSRLRPVIERAVAQVFGEVEVVFRGPGAPPAAVTPGPVLGTVDASLTFDAYQPSEGNLLAFHAMRDLAEAVPGAPSPVVIYGPPGLGKTHLLHAAAGAASRAGRAVACLDAGTFTSRFVGDIRSGRSGEFHDALCGLDLLILDDLQQLAGRRATQEAFAAALDAVMHRGGHVAVASEQHPFDLDLLDRLTSRLVQGIVTRVEPFDDAARRAFIERVARRHRIALPAWAIDRLAACRAPSVRLLLGAVNQAIALQRMGRLDLARLDAAVARIAIAEAAGAEPTPGLLERIARYFSVEAAEIAGRSRQPRVGEARAVAAALLQEQGMSLAQVGALLGGRDKSTVSALARKGAVLLEAHPQLRERKSA
ncbi:MAG: DnaA/Hda family protein [Tepidiforma sp.]|nr:DnaA/Hda family protein [Tepidiforma sp.]GIW19464.1 MAG: chromosomal replication initiator protein DnaA [Tepidiforma sp.]